ncbi:recombinase family protein [Litchfieldia salsa]|uniref:Site-specific DNA recombinase n=1 Tax=Litchfieldia salsa TaxID=930152 RepID=A0A1H0VPB7_9BACI|nr:recombinase family protein [Litchfieldia salsa]SDP80452.1 Site-specific DNA recombinase [Litchfieldia salsa]
MTRLYGLDLDLYIRKSRKDIEEEKKAEGQGQTYDTLERHRKRLLEVAKRENHNILEIHEEVVSGEFITERPKIQKLLRRVEASEIDAVLVIDLDRLGRGDMLDQGLLDRAFRYSGTKIITPNEIYDPEDESWELVFGVKSLVARQELKSITKRLQNGRRDSVKEGKSISRKPPYGYLRDEKLKLYPDPETSWIVKKIFEMMSGTYGRRTVAEELNKLSISPPTGVTWEPTTIAEMIQNEVYLGSIIWGKFKSVKRNGKYIRKKQPKESWLIKSNAHEPIVSEELFKAANMAYKQRWKPHTIKGKKLSNPLAGILKCEICGKAMANYPRKDRPNDQIRCSNIACKGIQRGASLNIIEEKVLQSLAEIVESFELPLKEHNKEIDSDTPLKRKALEKKEKEIEEIIGQKNNLHDLLERGVYTVDVFIERQKILTDRIKELNESIKLLSNEIELEAQIEKTQNEFVPKIKTVLESYHLTDDIEMKNMLLKSVITKATFLRKNDWKKRDQFIIQLYPHI